MNGRFLKKNVVLALIVSAAIITAGVFIFYTKKNSTTTAASLNIQRVVSQTVSADTDEDGLKDWEESLWGTDPKSPDTDGDGVSDGDEVDQNRDPLVVGEGVPKKANRDTSTEKTNTSNKTVTEGLAVELFSNYLQLKNSGDLGVVSGEQLITSAINTTVKERVVPIYSTNDIAVITSPTKEELLAYDTRLSQVFNPDRVLESDVVVLKRALETNNTEELETLDYTVSLYSEVLDSMLSLKVPEPVSVKHIAAVNALVRFIDNVKSMRAVYTDPLPALIGIKEYDANGKAFFDNMLAIGAYLKPYRTSS